MSRDNRDRPLIGKGYTYNVYDLGKGRVLKTEKTLPQILVDTYFYEGQDVKNYLKTIARLIDKSRVIEINRYVRLYVDPVIVGHPVFLGGINYEQDRVEPLGTILERSGPAAKRDIIDQYIESIFAHWENGFSDTVFNFTINSGLGSGGNMVLLDFNEIVMSKQETQRRIVSKRWFRTWSYKQLDPGLQDYYSKRMDEIITVDALNEHWRGK